jgi:hypothetical protein
VKIDFRATTPCEAAALTDFLGRIFQPGGASLLAEKPMAWKYWSARPDWTGSRSFAARRDGAIVAHAAAWPVRVCVPGRVVPAAHLIDWAADPAADRRQGTLDDRHRRQRDHAAYPSRPRFPATR